MCRYSLLRTLTMLKNKQDRQFFRSFFLQLFFIVISAYPLYAKYYEDTAAARLHALLETELSDSARTEVLYQLGDRLLKQEPEKARKYLERSLQLATLWNNSRQLKQILERLGVYYKDKGKMGIALSYQLKVLKLSEEQNDSFRMAIACNNVGIIYKTLHNYNKALEYYSRSNMICEKMGKVQGYIMTLNNLGTVYSDQHLYDKAIPYFDKALARALAHNDPAAMVVALANLGECFMAKGDFNKALNYYWRCLKLDEQSGDQFGILFTRSNIALTYNLMGKKEEALKYYQQCLKLARELDAKNDLTNLYASISGMYEKAGDHKLAYENQVLYRAYKDSVYNEENSRQMAELQTRYETEKKEHDIVLLNKEKELNEEELGHKQATIYSAATALFIILLLLMLVFNMYRQKQQANRLLLILDQEKNEFLGIAAHDLKNPLQTIMGYCQLQREYFDKLNRDKILKYTRNIELTARRMVELISNLLDINAIEQGKIEAKPEAIDLADFIKNSIQAFEVQAAQKGIRIESTCKEGLILHTDLYMLSQVFENLLSNAVKYSALNSTVWVRSAADSQGIFVEVKDSGPGIPEGEQHLLFKKFSRLNSRPTAGESSSGLGLSIVKKLCERMHADISCSNTADAGACFRFSFSREAQL